MSGMFGILFYSGKKCPTSDNLRKVMHDQELLQFFTQQCVDTMSIDELVKMGLKVIPTLVVLQKNGGKQIYDAPQAFQWVESIVRSRREAIIKTAEHTRKLINIDNTKMQIKDNLQDHDPLVTSGVSDGFSSWNNDITKDNSDAQPKNYLPYGKDEQFRIMTFVDNGAKISSAEQEKQLASVMQTRNIQTNTIKKFYEQQQINTVVSKQGVL